MEVLTKGTHHETFVQKFNEVMKEGKLLVQLSERKEPLFIQFDLQSQRKDRWEKLMTYNPEVMKTTVISARRKRKDLKGNDIHSHHSMCGEEVVGGAITCSNSWEATNASPKVYLTHKNPQEYVFKYATRCSVINLQQCVGHKVQKVSMPELKNLQDLRYVKGFYCFKSHKTTLPEYSEEYQGLTLEEAMQKCKKLKCFGFSFNQGTARMKGLRHASSGIQKASVPWDLYVDAQNRYVPLPGLNLKSNLSVTSKPLTNINKAIDLCQEKGHPAFTTKNGQNDCIRVKTELSFNQGLRADETVTLWLHADQIKANLGAA